MRSDAKTLAASPVAPRLAAIARPRSSGLRDPTARQPRAALCLRRRRALRAKSSGSSLKRRVLTSTSIRRGAPPKPGKARARAVSRPRRLSTRSSSARHTRDARSRLDAFGQTHDAPVTPGVAPSAVSRARPPSRAHARPRRPRIRGERAAAVRGAADSGLGRRPPVRVMAAASATGVIAVRLSGDARSMAPPPRAPVAPRRPASRAEPRDASSRRRARTDASPEKRTREKSASRRRRDAVRVRVRQPGPDFLS